MRATKQNYERACADLKTIQGLATSFARTVDIGTIKVGDESFDINAFEFGPDDPSLPLVFITGGVHGLEFIGTQVAISMLESLVQMLHWDKSIEEVLKKIRVVFYPMVNPYGLYHGTRSNANGVDLMRNAPIDANVTSKLPLISGHRVSPSLPWYRGKKGEGMEQESVLLCEYFSMKTFGTPYVVSLDVHSGFGTRDRLWFPYAKSREPFHHIIEVARFKHLFDLSHPNHVYVIEPQSRHYTTHGDLWDYCFDLYHNKNQSGIFLPFCLEIGSWNWVKKNPLQILSLFGLFNPIKKHRLQRTMRRHHILFDFLLRTTFSWKEWAVPGSRHEKVVSEHEAISLWYRR